MKNKKMGAALITALCLLYIIRVTIVNVKAQDFVSKTEYHSMGEAIEIGENYFDTISENPDGYILSVLSAQFKTFDEFKADHPDISFDKVNSKIKYIYDVEMSFRNVDNQEGYINLARYNLQSVTEQVYIDYELMKLLEPRFGDFPAFRVKVGTERSYHLPFVANLFTEEKEGAYLKGEKMFLALSQYPVKHVVPLQF